MELIQIETSKDNKQYVKAKHLYNRLGLNLSEWSRWRTRNIENNEFFLENKDWNRFVITPNRGGKSEVDYNITIEFAKHLAMMAKTNKSHEIRNYFIECENKLSNTPELPNFTDPAEAAIAWAQQYKEKQQALALIEQQKPLVEFANNVANTASSITIHGFAAILSKDKINIGEKRLFQWFRDNGYLTKNNIVTQYAKDGGWLKTIEKTRVCAKTNSIVPYAQTLVTGKGQLFFAKKLMNEFNNKDK